MEQLHNLKAIKETEILPVMEEIKDIFNWILLSRLTERNTNKNKNIEFQNSEESVL